MSTLIGLICLLFIRAIYAVSLSLCDVSNYLEVKEGQNNTFVCTGLSAQQNVDWLWNFAPLSTCTTTSCTNRYPQFFQISWGGATSSHVTLYTTAFPDLDFLATTNLSCQQGSTNNRVTCQLDVVYPAEDPKCQIQFSGDTWDVTGWCNVPKARSRRNRYGCYVYQTSQNSNQLVGNFTMSTEPISGTNYASGDCQIKIAFPPEGKYNYSVTIIPGEVQVFPSFNGSNEIRRPSQSPTHDCPQYVTEGDDLDCFCFSNNLGLPSGSLIWKGANSSRLSIDKVNRTYSGTSNTCMLTWNKTVVQSTLYTVTVNYAPRVLSFKIENRADDVVNVTENTNVSVVCQAEGRPLPTISLYKKGSDNLNHNIFVANNVSELKYTINIVSCEAAYNYFCKSENNISMDQRNILLIVLCSPKTTTNESYFTTFVNGEASLTFKMNAYPSPKLLSIFFNESTNNSNSRKVELENTVRSTCLSDSSYSYMTTCTVTLLNETIYTFGMYTVIFSNALGHISFAFEVKEKLQTTTTPIKITDSPGPLPGPIVGGVIGGVVFIALTVVIIIFIVRRKGKHNKGPSLPNNTVEEDLSEEQNNRADAPKDVYAIVEKDPKPTTASRMTDVYADVVKKETERTEVDFTASTLSPGPEDATKDKKEKISKTPGKRKKKGKGDKKPLSAKNTGIKSGGALSMSPMTESEYENCGFDEKEQGKERKGAKEIQRRNQQGLNYTTVLFDNTTITPTPPPVLEPTEYAEIVPRQKPRD